MLQAMTWSEAKDALHADTVVVLPLGAAAKEHGLHLKLDNDLRIAEYLAGELVKACDVLLAPVINYSYYPSFVEYPGSVSLTWQTAAAMVAEICLSLSVFGPRRFYALNTGISTNKPLIRAAQMLEDEGVLLTFTDFHAAMAPAAAECAEQEGGSHADELETSIMLTIAPDSVDMSKAARDFIANRPGRLSLDPRSPYCYSPSGVWGDATLANTAKGDKIVKCLVEQAIADIDHLRAADLPGRAK